MYDVIGKSNPTYLLADPNGADVFSIPCEPKNGTVARGTVMVRKETGLWAPAATADVAETNQLALLGREIYLRQGKPESRGSPDRRPPGGAAEAGLRLRPDGPDE